MSNFKTDVLTVTDSLMASNSIQSIVYQKLEQVTGISDVFQNFISAHTRTNNVSLDVEAKDFFSIDGNIFGYICPKHPINDIYYPSVSSFNGQVTVSLGRFASESLLLDTDNVIQNGDADQTLKEFGGICNSLAEGLAAPGSQHPFVSEIPMYMKLGDYVIIRRFQAPDATPATRLALTIYDMVTTPATIVNTVEMFWLPSQMSIEVEVRDSSKLYDIREMFHEMAAAIGETIDGYSIPFPSFNDITDTIASALEVNSIMAEIEAGISVGYDKVEECVANAWQAINAKYATLSTGGRQFIDKVSQYLSSSPLIEAITSACTEVQSKYTAENVQVVSDSRWSFEVDDDQRIRGFDDGFFVGKAIPAAANFVANVLVASGHALARVIGVVIQVAVSLADAVGRIHELDNINYFPERRNYLIGIPIFQEVIGPNETNNQLAKRTELIKALRSKTRFTGCGVVDGPGYSFYFARTSATPELYTIKCFIKPVCAPPSHQYYGIDIIGTEEQCRGWSIPNPASSIGQNSPMCNKAILNYLNSSREINVSESGLIDFNGDNVIRNSDVYKGVASSLGNLIFIGSLARSNCLGCIDASTMLANTFTFSLYDALYLTETDASQRTKNFNTTANKLIGWSSNFDRVSFPSPGGIHWMFGELFPWIREASSQSEVNALFATIHNAFALGIGFSDLQEEYEESEDVYDCQVGLCSSIPRPNFLPGVVIPTITSSFIGGVLLAGVITIAASIALLVGATKLKKKVRNSLTLRDQDLQARWLKYRNGELTPEEVTQLLKDQKSHGLLSSLAGTFGIRSLTGGYGVGTAIDLTPLINQFSKKTEEADEGLALSIGEGKSDNDREFKKLNSAIEDVNDDISDVRNDLSDVGDDVSKLKTNLSSFSESASRDISTIKDATDTLESAVAAQSEELTNTNDKLLTIEKRLDKLFIS